MVVRRSKARVPNDSPQSSQQEGENGESRPPGDISQIELLNRERKSIMSINLDIWV